MKINLILFYEISTKVKVCETKAILIEYDITNRHKYMQEKHVRPDES